jgi:hypothetical protein
MAKEKQRNHGVAGFVLVLSMMVCLWARDGEAHKQIHPPPLRFNSDGEFKIIQVGRFIASFPFAHPLTFKDSYDVISIACY